MKNVFSPGSILLLPRQSPKSAKMKFAEVLNLEFRTWMDGQPLDGSTGQYLPVIQIVIFSEVS